MFLIDGPSGTGKSTLLRKLLDDASLRLTYRKRVTTRARRPDDGEHGDYDFVTQERFSEMAARGELAEYRNFLFGMSYGLPRDPVEELIRSGGNAVAIINLGSYDQVKAVWPDCVNILLISPIEEIEARLRARGTNTEEQIAERLSNARKALELAPYYDYVVPNRQGRLERTMRELTRIVRAHLPPPDGTPPSASSSGTYSALKM